MFKPSLRKSVLNNNLCLTTQTKTDPFAIPTQQKPKPIHRFNDTITTFSQTTLPSMMIPQQIIQKHQFYNQNNYTHIFTPLSYDFKPYPRKVNQIINSNPKAAQSGRINQVNYVVFGQNLLLWRSINNGQEQDMIHVQKFKEPINIAAFSVIRNEKMFKKDKVTIMAVSFENRLKLYKLDESQLSIHDMMINYQIKSCRFIQKIHFTQQNEIVIAGDSGQFSMISLNGTKQLIVKVKSSIIQKYLSKSAFDYSTRHIIRQIQVSKNFLYCLHDRISKSNYLMYLLKKTINKVVMLSQQPKHIYQETFVDVYKFTNSDRNQVMFLTQLKQNDIQKKIKEGYINFWGQGVKDAFRIVSISCKGQQTSIAFYKGKSEDKEANQGDKKSTQNIEKAYELINPLIQLTTKCGYVVALIHETSSHNNSSGDKDNFSFATQPGRLPSKIGQASLFEPKVFMSGPQQKEYRKSYAIKSVSLNKDQKITLLNDSLMLSNQQGISLVRFNDLKMGIYDTTTQEQTYISEEEFNRIYQPYNINNSQPQQTLFGRRTTVYNRQEKIKPNKYYRLFNNQKRWTCFDNDGRFHIYPLDVKHILLSYLYYQCEFNNQNYKNSSQFDHYTHSLIESDLRLHSTIQKIIRLYGYSTFMTALVEILINNSNNQREYFYLQRDLLLEVIKRDFEYELANSFEDWSYSLAQKNQAQKIVPTDKMLQFVWITLFEHQNKPILTSETILSKTPVSQYAQKAKHYSEAKSQLEYTAYGYALKSKFYQIIEILIYFRAKEFKIKEKQLKQCQLNLVQFFNFLEMKKLKSQTQEYKTYLNMKLSNLTRKKQYNQQYPKNLNATLSTTVSSLNSSQDIFATIDQESDTGSLKRGVTHQANQTLEKYINKSIQKIISLIDVMNILIEKDQRQGLPNFIEIVTNFKNQIKIGSQFFKEELFFSPNTVEFIHPELVKQVDAALPELQLQTKIDFLKFKLAKNIAISNSLSQIDLKSLNFNKLSELVTSSEISEVKKMFLGQANEPSFQKIYFYTQFLTISLAKLIQKVKQLSALKQQKFNSLSGEGSMEKKKIATLVSHMTVEKIIISQQQLQYYQEEMEKFFEQIKALFASSVKSLRIINGPQYYQAESYLDRMIELLSTNFGTQQIMVQTLQIILKDANFFDKVHYMKQVKDRVMYLKDSDVQILKISKEKETKLDEKSTFQYLIDTQSKKTLAQERTHDTLNSGSLR